MAGVDSSITPWYRRGMRIPSDLKRGLKTFGSREALATELGVSAQTIWRWMHGQVIPEPELRLLRRVVEEAVRRD